MRRMADKIRTHLLVLLVCNRFHHIVADWLRTSVPMSTTCGRVITAWPTYTWAITTDGGSFAASDVLRLVGVLVNVEQT